MTSATAQNWIARAMSTSARELLASPAKLVFRPTETHTLQGLKTPKNAFSEKIFASNPFLIYL